MKPLYCSLGFVTIFFILGLSGPALRSAPPRIPASGAALSDAGTDVVHAFYEALLQNASPTLIQEKGMFNNVPRQIRERLAAGGFGGENESAVMNFFRKHKDLFLPKNMKGPSDVMISSSFQFRRKAGDKQPVSTSDDTYVIAMFVDDLKAVPAKNRTVVFQVTANKIDCDAIFFNGFEGKSTEEELLK